LLTMILVLNLLFTAISYGSTAQGGIFLPTLVIGAIGGGIYYNIIAHFSLIDINNDYFVNFIILAMAAMLSSVVRSPIISIMLVTEMTGSFEHILSLCMVSITAYLVAEICRCKPIYEELFERMLNSSLQETENNYINEKVLHQFIINYDSSISGTYIKDIDMPFNALIVSIKRLDNEIIPKGNTVIKGGDTITVLTDNKHLKDIVDYFDNI
ncbi:chloride channel protein, partial [Peptoanaerobacter stomatis]